MHAHLVLVVLVAALHLQMRGEGRPQPVGSSAGGRVPTPCSQPHPVRAPTSESLAAAGASLQPLRGRPCLSMAKSRAACTSGALMRLPSFSEASTPGRRVWLLLPAPPTSGFASAATQLTIFAWCSYHGYWKEAGSDKSHSKESPVFPGARSKGDACPSNMAEVVDRDPHSAHYG